MKRKNNFGILVLFLLFPLICGCSQEDTYICNEPYPIKIKSELNFKSDCDGFYLYASFDKNANHFAITPIPDTFARPLISLVWGEGIGWERSYPNSFKSNDMPEFFHEAYSFSEQWISFILHGEAEEYYLEVFLEENNSGKERKVTFELGSYPFSTNFVLTQAA